MRSLLRLGLVLLAVAVASAETVRPKQESRRVGSPSQIGYGSAQRQFVRLSATYLQAAEALRRGDFTESLQLLEPLANSSAPAATTARLILGFYSNRAGNYVDAVRLLESVEGLTQALDDWRLFTLAEAARELENYPTALRSLSTLLADYPESPLRADALVTGAEIARESEDLAVLQLWIEQSRRDRLPAEQGEQIERLAWQAGEEANRIELQRDAARRLLTNHPVVAEELGVIRVFDRDGASLSLREVLDTDELRARARRLLEDGLEEEAIASLEWIADPQRDIDWTLLYAEALTDDQRGLEAYRRLESVASSDPQIEAEVAWHRALAAFDAAKARRGRRNLPQSERTLMLQIGVQQLQRVVELDIDAETSMRALKLLFAKLSDEDDFEAAKLVLVRLQKIDPSDTTGRRYLWRLGWQAYSERDYPVAIGYWSELGAMYPQSTDARSGRYWTGRAHETLGHQTRSRVIFEEIVETGAEDFYSRHARIRLNPETISASSEATLPTEPWPADSRLERALWLSDLGLDDYALLELEALRPRSDPRAQFAAEAVVLARSGRRRDSIRALAQAFPALGRPNQAIVPEEALRLYYPLDFRDIIERYSTQKDLSPYLVFAMVRQESAFDVSAKSWAGARGLMQLMPATGKELAHRMGLRFSTDRLSDPEFSVRLGTSYYSQVLDMFNGNHELALAGYNGGPYRIKKLWRQAGSNPELDEFLESLGLEETKTYVKRILLFENSYRKLYSRAG